MIGIDLFSGAGGMSLGARMAGVDVQLVVEADKHAAETYLHNHKPSLGLYQGDIRSFEPFEINKDSSKATVVFGGPPCQGFSTSNQTTRNSENDNNWLFQEFVRVVNFYMPEWVIFENVKGILETEGGIFVDKIVSSLSELGYTVSTQLLQAVDFGVPQKRSRFFAVGSLQGKTFEFPEPIATKAVTVADALCGLPRLENGASQCYMPYAAPPKSEYAKVMKGACQTGCNNHLVTRNNSEILKRYEHIPQGGNWEDIPESLMGNYKDRMRCHTGIYRRLISTEPSVVIGNYRKNMLIHPVENRGLSVREAARLQSFPDSFEFKGSIGFQQQQVGNAVPPLLSKAIFDKLLTY
ncbi:MAG: DNA cytosine methyltransferase [Neptuniibacter sp.]